MHLETSVHLFSVAANWQKKSTGKSRKRQIDCAKERPSKASVFYFRENIKKTKSGTG